MGAPEALSATPRRDAPYSVSISGHAVRVGAATGWRLALAGGLAGALTNCVLFPLDTVKTLRQTYPGRFSGALPAARAVLRTRGPAGLYAGVSPALLGSALSSALYFGTYELVRRRARARARRRMPVNAVAAACGNVASSVLFVPKEVVKQRMQAGVDRGGFVRAARALLRADGVAGLYRGYAATLLRNIPSNVLRFVLYEEAKVLLRRRRDARLTTAEHLAAGAASGAVASAAMTPMDVIKTRLATGRAPAGAGIARVAADVVRERGLAGLYAGVRPRVLWSALFAAIGFSSYELCKAWLAPAYAALMDEPAPARPVAR